MTSNDGNDCKPPQTKCESAEGKIAGGYKRRRVADNTELPGVIELVEGDCPDKNDEDDNCLPMGYTSENNISGKSDKTEDEREKNNNCETCKIFKMTSRKRCDFEKSKLDRVHVKLELEDSEIITSECTIAHEILNDNTYEVASHGSGRQLPKKPNEYAKESKDYAQHNASRRISDMIVSAKCDDDENEDVDDEVNYEDSDNEDNEQVTDDEAIAGVTPEDIETHEILSSHRQNNISETIIDCVVSESNSEDNHSEDEEFRIIWPHEDFATLEEGLSRSDAWTVYPTELASCLHAAANLILKRQDESLELQRFYNDVVPNAFSKCLADSNVLRWNKAVITNITLAVRQLFVCVTAKARSLIQIVSELGEQVPKFDDDSLHSLLRCLTSAFDRDSNFQKRLLQNCTPFKLPSHKITVAFDGPSIKESSDEISVIGDIRYYTTALVDDFSIGLAKLTEFLRYPEHFSLRLISAALEPISSVYDLLLQSIQIDILINLKNLLRYLCNIAQTEIERLNDKASDGSTGYVYVCQCSLHLSNILNCYMLDDEEVMNDDVNIERNDAAKLLKTFQKYFVQNLLDTSSFQKQIAAVKELNGYLRNQLVELSPLSQIDISQRRGEVGAWLQKTDIVEKMLKNNLHHKQYSEQVQEIMQCLIQQKCFCTEYHDLLWAILEKRDTFEAVRSNVIDMLAESAWVMAECLPNCYQILLSRIRSNYEKNPADRKAMVRFIENLVTHDLKGSCAQHIHDLCWALMNQENYRSEDDDVNASIEARLMGQVIVRYARCQHSVYARKYMKLCIEGLLPNDERFQINISRKILILKVLTIILGDQAKTASFSIIEQGSREERRQSKECCLFSVLTEMNENRRFFIKALIDSIDRNRYCDIKEIERHSENNSVQIDSFESRKYLAFIRSAMNVIQYCASVFAEKLECEDISSLWESLVVNQMDSVRDFFFTWMSQLVQHNFVSTVACSWLLAERMTSIESTTITESSFTCFNVLLLSVGLDEGKIVQEDNGRFISTNSLDLIGLDALWRFMLDASSHQIGENAVRQINQLYLCVSDKMKENKVDVWRRMLTKAILHMEEASTVIKASRTQTKGIKKNSKEMALDNPATCTLQNSSRRVERCLMLIKTCIEECDGRETNALNGQRTNVSFCPYAHGCAYKGLPVRVDVHFHSPQYYRFRLLLHTNNIVGELKDAVARHIGGICSGKDIRLSVHQNSLDWDGRMLWQVNITEDGTIVKAAQILDNLSPQHIEESSKMDGTNLRLEENFQSNRQHEQTDFILEKDKIVGVFLSHNSELYENLFNFAEMDLNPYLRDLALHILNIIPTSPSLIRELEIILSGFPCDETASMSATADKELTNRLREVFSGTSSKVKYSVQTLESLTSYGCSRSGTNLVGSDSDIRHKRDKYFNRFISLNGIKILADALHSVKGPSQRRCYVSGMVIFRQIIGVLANHTPQHSDNSDQLSYFCSETIMLFLNAMCTSIFDISVFDLKEELQGNTDLQNDLTIMNMRTKGRENTTAEDAHLSEEALWLITSLLVACGTEMLSQLKDNCTTKIILLGCTLLNDSQFIRERCIMPLLKVLEILSKNDDNVAFACDVRLFFFDIFVRHRHIADNDLYEHSPPFYVLISAIVKGMITEIERPYVRELLQFELQYLLSLCERDYRGERYLESRTKLAKTLLLTYRELNFRDRLPEEITCIDHLMKKALFPSSAVLEKISNMDVLSEILPTVVSYSSGPQESLQHNTPFRSLRGWCNTRACRSSILELLSVLCASGAESMEIAELVQKMHLIPKAGYLQQSWDYLPEYSPRSGNYVGLKNAGATCYMNAVFQQLFMQTRIRDDILSAGEICLEKERDSSVLYQLQTIFASLQMSELDHFVPAGFWKAFRDYDGVPVDVHEHQDAFEFLTRLLDQVDQQLREACKPAAMQNVLGGQFVQQVICSCCQKRSETLQDFMGISVDVRGKKGLEESLASYVQGELLEADNAYFCESCGDKMDAVKRVVVKSLPKTLVIHLKRFEFDYNTMNRLKLKDYFEFPATLDMFPYTVDGVEMTSKGKSTNIAEDSNNERAPLEKKCMEYELCGVVVHSGTAFAGHYYSYIRENSNKTSTTSHHSEETGREVRGDVWYTFDDRNVELYDITDMERDCFGGKYVVDVFDTESKCTIQREYDRPNSAYMLLYKVKENQDELKVEGRQTQLFVPNSTIPESSCLTFSACPESICHVLFNENVILNHEISMLDADYFRFVRHILGRNCDERDLKFRKTVVNKERNSVFNIINSSSNILDKFNTDGPNDIKCFSVLLDFMINIVFRSHESFRGPIKDWISIMKEITLDDQVAAAHLSTYLCSNPGTIMQLSSCPNEEIRYASARVFASCLNALNEEYWSKVGARIVVDIFSQALHAKGEALTGFLIEVLLEVCISHNGARTKRLLVLRKGIHDLTQWIVQIQSLLLTATAKNSLSVVLTLLGVLVRSCDAADVCREGSGLESDAELQVNPYQINASVAALDFDSVSALLSPAILGTLAQESYDSQEVRDLFAFLSWENEGSSSRILSLILNTMALEDDVAPSLQTINVLIKLKDRWQRARIELAFGA